MKLTQIKEAKKKKPTALQTSGGSANSATMGSSKGNSPRYRPDCTGRIKK